MKALELLVKYQDEIQTAVPSEIEIDEAIEELEDFQNRKCATCKHLENIEKSYKHCNELGIHVGHLTWDDFYCAYWEAKND